MMVDRPLAVRAALLASGIALVSAMAACTLPFGTGAAKPPAAATPSATGATSATGAAPAPAPASNAPAASAATPAPATPAPAGGGAPPPPPPVLTFEQALERAADATFATAEGVLGMPASGQRELIIDPLVDAATGQQTMGTVQMGKWMQDYVTQRRKSFVVRPFTRETLARSPVLAIGTLTAVNQKGDATARADAFRIWFTLVDLRTGRVIGKSIQRATEDSVDARPTEYFRETPSWVKDRTVAGYINSCQVNTKIGDPIDPVYLMRLPAAAVINEAIDAYNAHRYADAYRLYSEAQGAADPNDLRVLNGLYLSAWKLRRLGEAQEAFRKIVAAGLSNRQLPLKILFTPGGTVFIGDAQISQQYPVWIRNVAETAARRQVCLNVVGHTSRTGSPDVNEALSARRAATIRARMETQPGLGGRLSSAGVGYRENLVGLGTDDLRDALDRRVEFRVVDCRKA